MNILGSKVLTAPFGGCCETSVTSHMLARVGSLIPASSGQLQTGGRCVCGNRAKPCDLRTQAGFRLAAFIAFLGSATRPPAWPEGFLCRTRRGFCSARSFCPVSHALLPKMEKWTRFFMVHFHKTGSACKSISSEHTVNGLWSVRGLYC